MSRGKFILSATAIACIVTMATYLSGTHMLPASFAYIAVAGLTLQIALIKHREMDLYPGRRWRFWYATGVGIMVVSFITSHIVSHGPGAPEDYDRVRSQLLLGGFVLFHLFLLPVTLPCTFRQSARQPSRHRLVTVLL